MTKTKSRSMRHPWPPRLRAINAEWKDAGRGRLHDLLEQRIKDGYTMARLRRYVNTCLPEELHIKTDQTLWDYLAILRRTEVEP